MDDEGRAEQRRRDRRRGADYLASEAARLYGEALTQEGDKAKKLRAAQVAATTALRYDIDDLRLGLAEATHALAQLVDLGTAALREIRESRSNLIPFEERKGRIRDRDHRG